MNTRGAFRKALQRLPAAWAVILGFTTFVGAATLLAQFLPPVRDPVAECAKQCEPRAGRLVNDMNYPMSAKGQYRQVCVCT